MAIRAPEGANKSLTTLATICDVLVAQVRRARKEATSAPQGAAGVTVPAALS